MTKMVSIQSKVTSSINTMLLFLFLFGEVWFLGIFEQFRCVFVTLNMDETSLSHHIMSWRCCLSCLLLHCQSSNFFIFYLALFLSLQKKENSLEIKSIWSLTMNTQVTEQFTSSFMMRLSASPNDNVRFLTLSAFLGPFFFFFFLGFSSSSSSSSSSDSSTGIMIWIGARMAPAFSSVWSTSSVFPKYVISQF